MSDKGHKVIFLDRDGTINEEKNYLYRQEDFVYLDSVIESLRSLRDMGFILVVITNQSGIARGYYTEEDYLQLDAWMRKDMKSKGVELAGTYHCPHLKDGSVVAYAKMCDCRKPGTALFWKAAKELNIDMDSSYAIGDRIRDLSICKESGVKGILLSDTEEHYEDIICCRNWKSILDAIKVLEGDK